MEHKRNMTAGDCRRAMAKRLVDKGTANGEAIAEAEVAAVIDAFGGDAKAALRALIAELDILRRQTGGQGRPYGLSGTGHWRHRRRHLQ